MKYSLLGWSIERPNIHSRCYSTTGTMYAYTSLLNSMQTLHFTQVNDPLTGQLYFPSQSIWSAQPRCWPWPIGKSAPHSPEPLTAIDPGQLKKNWLSQTIMNRTQAIAHGFPACEIELAINRA